MWFIQMVEHCLSVDSNQLLMSQLVSWISKHSAERQKLDMKEDIVWIHLNETRNDRSTLEWLKADQLLADQGLLYVCKYIHYCSH